MTNKTKHGKKHFYRYWLQYFYSSKVLKCHVKNCLAISRTKSVLLPEEGQYVNFQNFKRLTKSPFIIHGDFERVLISSTNTIDFGPKTKEYQNHILCSYICKLIRVDERYSKPYKTHFDEDAVNTCLNDMIKESEYCSKVIETKFDKPLIMT